MHKRRLPTHGLNNMPALTAARTEQLLGIDSPAQKSHRQMRMEAEAANPTDLARQEALRNLAAAQRQYMAQQEKK